MDIIKFIKKICSNGTAIWPNNDRKQPYRIYEASLFGALYDTQKNMSLKEVTSHIYELLQKDKTVYIEKRGTNNRPKARDQLIQALNHKDENIQIPLADNTIYLQEKWMLKWASRPFLMVQTKTN